MHSEANVASKAGEYRDDHCPARLVIGVVGKGERGGASCTLCVCVCVCVVGGSFD